MNRRSGIYARQIKYQVSPPNANKTPASISRRKRSAVEAASWIAGDESAGHVAAREFVEWYHSVAVSSGFSYLPVYRQSYTKSTPIYTATENFGQTDRAHETKPLPIEPIQTDQTTRTRVVQKIIGILT